MQDALLQRLAEREVGYYGKPGLSRPGAITKGAAPGMVPPTQHHPFAQACSACPLCTQIPACEAGTRMARPMFRRSLAHKRLLIHGIGRQGTRSAY